MTADPWDEHRFLAVLKDFAPGGTIDASDKRIDANQLARILEAIPRDAEGRHLGRAMFKNTYFDGDANFSGVRFRSEAVFDGAEFAGKARFSGAGFDDWAVFMNATFHNGCDFSEATFAGEAVFSDVRCLGETRASFDGARFALDANFNGARFWNVQFNTTEFSGRFLSAGAHCARDAWFANAAFHASVTLGPMIAGRRLVVDGAIFHEDGQVHASTPELSCIRTRFSGRADLKLRWAEVVLDDALFLQRSWITGVQPFPDLDDQWVGSGDARRSGKEDLPLQERPRLLSMREANVANLALSNIDMRACRFAKAQSVDQLRLEADCEFAETPRGRLRTVRRTLAEEHEWRSQHDRRPGGWHPYECRLPSWVRPAETLNPPEIAALYRSLRKALEDSKDEPGAGDFYYGEMEMRRQHRSTGLPVAADRRRGIERAERWIVAMYRSLSGYGLRASRALTALMLLLVLWTAAFHLYGFQDRVRPYAAKGDLDPPAQIGFPPAPREVLAGLGSFEAWTYSAGTATAIIGAPEAQLTQVGRGLRVSLRILSPLLIGLALLAIRGRVKR